MDNITSNNNNAQSSNSSAQQFCLRWHNHQTSLLSTLPLLLDQSHLTDCTLSAEGRTVRAHRVVLSACSTFFLDLFQTVEPPSHPIIVLPGASFGTMVGLLTFMYSGEVNVYEEQIAGLLALAETLGIKGLADFNGNVSKASPSSPSKCETPIPKEPETPSPTPTPTKQLSTSPFENLLAKTFPFCPSLMQHPLNFTQSALSRSAEMFARYQNQCRLSTMEKMVSDHLIDENGNQKCLNLVDAAAKKKSATAKHSSTSDLRKIDQIAENLRCATVSNRFGNSTAPAATTIKTEPNTPISHHAQTLKTPPFTNLPHNFLNDELIHRSSSAGVAESMLIDHHHHQQQQALTQQSSFLSNDNMTSMLDKPPTMIPTNLPKTANSKLYATCFICHKQLSNQYNLRVHLETHQNVRYACNVCTHVSRSKDALRKHVSYRHPGAPSPCDTEARRKRTKIVHQPQPLLPTPQNALTTTINDNSMITSETSTSTPSPSQMTLQQHLAAAQSTFNLIASGNDTAATRSELTRFGNELKIKQEPNKIEATNTTSLTTATTPSQQSVEHLDGPQKNSCNNNNNNNNSSNLNN